MNNVRLKNIIKYAYEKVPFYINKDIDKKIFEDENALNILRQLPVVDKEDIIKSDNNISAEYAVNRKQDITYAHTSGSTGKCMDIMWDKSDVNKSMLSLWLYRLKYYGIKMSDRLCYFYTTGNFPESRELKTDYEEGRNRLGFSKLNLNENRIAEIYKHMKEYRPVWINMQPSIGMLLAEYINRNKLEKIQELKYIELTGEMLFDNVRKEIEKAFGCRVANQYGCYEGNSIAYECPCGNLHCMEENIYVEVLDKEGKEVPEGSEGDIVITTLHNHAMPFIRYRIGDRGILDRNTRCNCGNISSVLRLKSGRISDYAVLKDGSKINSYVFVRAIDMARLKENTNVLFFQSASL